MSVVATMTMCAVSAGEAAPAWIAISSAEKRCIVRSKLRKCRSSRYHAFAPIVTWSPIVEPFVQIRRVGRSLSRLATPLVAKPASRVRLFRHAAARRASRDRGGARRVGARTQRRYGSAAHGRRQEEDE